MAVNKPSNLSNKMWASAGTVEMPSDAKIASGWTVEVPKFQTENWVQGRNDQAIGHINERGIAEWDATTNYIAGKSYVQGSDGKLYISKANSGPSSSVQNPVTDADELFWGEAFAKRADIPTGLTSRVEELEAFEEELIDSNNPAKGSALVGRGVVAVDDMISFLALPAGVRRADLRFLLKGYHSGTSVGGGEFFWDASIAKSKHDGGTVIDPTATFPDAWTNQSQLQAWFESVNIGQGCWVRVVDSTIRAEWFGVKSDGVIDDTIPLNALLAASDGYAEVTLPTGPSVVNGTLLLEGANDLCVNFNNAKLIQTATFTQMFKALLCNRIEIKNGYLQGLGGAGGEWTSGTDSPTWNGVAGIYLESCVDVEVHSNRVEQVAGTGIRWKNSDRVKVFNNDVHGIGSAYIQPDDNSNGFAVGGPVDDLTRRDYTFEVYNNRLSGHAFGIFANRIGSMRIQGNTVTDIPGQHGIYLIESNNTVISGNIFKRITGQAIKTQNENYVGRGVAPVGGNTNTENLLISSNNINDCASGIVLLTAPVYYPHDQFFVNVSITDNIITNCTLNDGMILQRVWGIVSDNQITDAERYGINLQACALTLSDNKITRAVVNGIWGDLYDDSEIEDNRLIDCGTANPGPSAGGGMSIYLQPISPANFITAPPSEYVVSFEANRIRFTAGDAFGTSVVACLDPRGTVEVFNTRTNSALPFRAGGRVVASGGNTFSGFFDAADNAPPIPRVGTGPIEFYGNVNPATAGLTQLFRRGDKCWNTNPSDVGQPVGWVCIAQGTPGTWAQFGVLV